MPTMFLLMPILLAIACLPALSDGASQRAPRSVGVSIQVTRFSVEPRTVTPGQQLTLRGEYSVIAPDRQARLTIIETVTTSFYDEETQEWKVVLRNHTSKTVAPGTHQFSPPAPIPPPARPPGGRFLLTFQVTSGGMSDQQSQEVLIGPPAATPPPQEPPPALVLRAPAPDQRVTTARVPVSGTATSTQGIAHVNVLINGALLVQRESAGQTTVDFSEQVALRPGPNEIAVTAVDQQNRSIHRRVTVTRIAEVPGTSHEKRLALVIGNKDYRGGAALPNAVNDAKDMAAALEQVGFRVILRENFARRAMEDVIIDFGEQLREEDVGLFYFAGHGVQVGGVNYLIPIGAEITREQHVWSEAVPVDRILQAMERARNRANIVILDACRNNPYVRIRSAPQGLAPMPAVTGMLIAYATDPGNVSSDGDGKNGLYTEALLQHIRTPGLKIEDVLKRVGRAVVEKTQGRQVPWMNSSLYEDVYFQR